MVRKGRSTAGEHSVSTKRAHRLFRLVSLLGKRPEERQAITDRLKVGVRDFYRDLKTLRESGIEVQFDAGKYRLAIPTADAVARLPFPDPNLSLGEAEALARGRTTAHRKLRDAISKIRKGSPPKAKARKR